MKKYWKLIVGIIAFVAFMVIVGVVYGKLSEEYKPEQNLVTGDGGSNKTPTRQDAEGGETSEATGGSKQEESQESEEGSQNATEEQQPSVELQQAPNFTVETEEGEEVSLHDFFGKPIVVNFWASWCGPCKMELPDFQAAYEKYEGEITFLMVNMTDGSRETKDTAMKYMKDAGYSLPVYYDVKQDAAYTYTVYSLPTTFFINAEGEAVAYAQGMIDAETLETGISMIYE